MHAAFFAQLIPAKQISGVVTGFCRHNATTTNGGAQCAEISFSKAALVKLQFQNHVCYVHHRRLNDNCLAGRRDCVRGNHYDD